MVLVTELPNAFWGVTVNEGKKYTQKLTGAIHVSMAALEPGSNKGDDGPVSVMIQHDKADFMLCSLSTGQVFQQALDLNFNDGEEVTFYLKGKGVVHLTGYLLTGDQYDSDSDADFLPGNNFAELEDDSSSSISSDDNDDDGEEQTGGSKKRKKQIVEKNAKKAKVEIVGDDDDEDDDEEDSDLDDDDDDDDEELTPKKKSDKKKPEQAKKIQLTPFVQSKKEVKDKSNQRPAETTTISKGQSTTTETGEKKKKKKKKNKKKKNAENSTQVDGGSSEEKSGPSKSKLVEGVAIEDLKVGHGPEAKSGSTVHVYYTGRLKSGKLFDQKNSGKPVKFRLGKKEIIKGWDVGLQGMKVGGKRKLVIPPNMGYGSQNLGTIPPNSTLEFEVELKAVN